jgi:hypothetical protein
MSSFQGFCAPFSEHETFSFCFRSPEYTTAKYETFSYLGFWRRNAASTGDRSRLCRPAGEATQPDAKMG